MELYQRSQLESALKEFAPSEQSEKDLFQDKMLQLRNMGH